MNSSGKQNSAAGAGQGGTGGKQKGAAAGGSSTKKQQQVFGQGILGQGAGDMLELNEIDLRISENIVDSGKLSDIA